LTTPGRLRAFDAYQDEMRANPPDLSNPGRLITQERLSDYHREPDWYDAYQQSLRNNPPQFPRPGERPTNSWSISGLAERLERMRPAQTPPMGRPSPVVPFGFVPQTPQVPLHLELGGPTQMPQYGPVMPMPVPPPLVGRKPGPQTPRYVIPKGTPCPAGASCGSR
jgi:hypothetical protein